MATLANVLSSLRKLAASPTVASAIVGAMPAPPDDKEATADAVLSFATDQLIERALAENPAVKATDAEKHLAKCGANARSLALAVLGLAAGKVPDVRAVHGWAALLASEDRSALAVHVEATIKALLDAGAGSCGEAAYRRGSNGLLGKGKLKAPTSAQAAARLLRDAWLASSASPALANPATSARKLAGTAKAMPVKVRAAAA